MFTIQLNHLQFFSFHGIYEEERILGNEYEVNLSLLFKTEEKITALEQSINYASVYDLVKKRMAIPAALLETLAQDLAQQIHMLDPRISTITVSVEKKNPPLPNIQVSVGVTYTKEY